MDAQGTLERNVGLVITIDEQSARLALVGPDPGILDGLRSEQEMIEARGGLREGPVTAAVPTREIEVVRAERRLRATEQGGIAVFFRKSVTPGVRIVVVPTAVA